METGDIKIVWNLSLGTRAAVYTYSPLTFSLGNGMTSQRFENDRASSMRGPRLG
jgi:hypothetical protein